MDMSGQASSVSTWTTEKWSDGESNPDRSLAKALFFR